MNPLQNFTAISSYDDLLQLVKESFVPLFIVIHQPTVNISVNQIAYINNNWQYLKHPIYFIEFEIIRTQLFESLRAANVNFAHFGFPCILLFYRQQIVFFESGALSIMALNELAELTIAHYSNQSSFV
jgi:hypothetical protein